MERFCDLAFEAETRAELQQLTTKHEEQAGQLVSQLPCPDLMHVSNQDSKNVSSDIRPGYTQQFACQRFCIGETWRMSVKKPQEARYNFKRYLWTILKVTKQDGTTNGKILLRSKSQP